MPVESIAYRNTLSVASQIQWNPEHLQHPRCYFYDRQFLLCLDTICTPVLSLRRLKRGPVWASDQCNWCLSIPPVTCLSFSSFHFHLLHFFPFPHSRFLLFSNLFLFFSPFLCPPLHLPHLSCPYHTTLSSFLLLFLTLYYSVTSFSTPSAVVAACLTSSSTFQKFQQCSSSISCYTLTYFSLLLYYFSHLPFHPCCSFNFNPA